MVNINISFTYKVLQLKFNIQNYCIDIIFRMAISGIYETGNIRILLRFTNNYFDYSYLLTIAINI